MFASHKEISPPSLVLKWYINELIHKEILKKKELKRMPTQTRLGGEIYFSDVIIFTQGPLLHILDPTFAERDIKQFSVFYQEP